MKYMGNVRSIIWQKVWIVVKRPIGALACHCKGEEEYRGSAEGGGFKTTSFATAESGEKGRTIIVVYSC
jgi:hypothetical protein